MATPWERGVLPESYETKIINRAKLKRFTLEFCKEKRPQFTRVSPEFLDRITEEIEILVKEEILFSEEQSRTLK